MQDRGEEGRPAVGTARSGGRCRECGSANLMTVGMLFEDSPVTVQVCSECESRMWMRDGAPVDVGELLHAFRSTSRGRPGASRRDV